ncbi:MAG: matrixin family metalloprotease [Verrucomicrobiaceae bacterium]|nr:matrixin family metalloprotease [Verrucomicrobiaceae bacterium]
MKPVFLPLLPPTGAALALLLLASCGALTNQDQGMEPSPPPIPGESETGKAASSRSAMCLSVSADPEAEQASQTKAYGPAKKFWTEVDQSHLRISFLPWRDAKTNAVLFIPGTKLRSKIEAAAREWINNDKRKDRANLTFEFLPDSEAHKGDIRICVGPDGYHRSQVGTDARAVTSTKAPTMWLGVKNDSDDSLRKVTLHEFGHALGLKHEQQHPGNTIPWDEPQVYQYYRDLQAQFPAMGWNDQMTKDWVLTREKASNHIVGPYDPESVMHYPVPEELTIGKFSTVWRARLSKGDITFIHERYP